MRSRVVFTTNVFLENLIQAIVCRSLCFLQRRNVASDQETCAHGMGRSLAFRLTGIYKSYAGNDEYYREASKIYLCCDPLGVIPIP